jgi:uncharacterized protein YraI
MRKSVVIIFAALSFSACLPLAASARPGYVASTVNLRAAPNTTSEVVTKIPVGSLVDTGDCTDGWCPVTFQDKKGFAIQTALDLSGRVPQARRSAAGPRSAQYYEDDDYVPVSPPVAYAPPPYYYGYRPYYYRPYWRRW